MIVNSEISCDLSKEEDVFLFKMSVIMPVHTDVIFLEESIENILNQSFDFNLIELILICLDYDDDLKEICLSYQNKFPHNVQVFNLNNKKDYSAKNLGINVARGKYLYFLDRDEMLTENTLEVVYNFFEDNYENTDIMAVPFKFSEAKKNPFFDSNHDSNMIIDLIKNPTAINFFNFSYFYKNSIENVLFDDNVPFFEDEIFFIGHLLKKQKIGLLFNTFCYGHNNSNRSNEIRFDSYLEKFWMYINDLFDFCKTEYGDIFDFIKFGVLKEIFYIFEKKSVVDIFNNISLDTLKYNLSNVLQEIDDELILNQKCDDKNLKYTILIFKHGIIDTKTFKNEHTVKKIVNGNIIDGLDYHILYIDSLEITDNKLNILGFLRSYFNYPEILIQAVKYNESDFLKYWCNFFNYNKLLFIKEEFLTKEGLDLQKKLFFALNANNFHDETYDSFSNLTLSKFIKSSDFENDSYLNRFDKKLSFSEIQNEFLISDVASLENYHSIYNIIFEKFIEDEGSIFDSEKIDYPYRERKYLDLNYISFFNFEFNILLDVYENSTVRLRVVYNSLKFYLNITFQKYAKISRESFYSKKHDDYIVYFIDNQFKIFNFSLNKLLYLEKSNINYLESKKDSSLEKVIDFRYHYYFSFFRYYNKRIWLFMDRLNYADDNAEHLFKYAINQNDGIEKYFVISKDSRDYSRLIELNNIVEAGSEEHKLLTCHAEKIISSQVDDEFLNPFYGDYEEYYNGLFKARIYFLQHGVTKDNVSSWLHKYDKFIYLITTVSKLEYDSFFDSKTHYNYDKSVVQLLGFPRYDNLQKLDDKKEIVVMPSWRRSLHNLNEEDFKKSNFYKCYNSILNDEKLINLLCEKNYKLIFKPHYNISKYMHLFNKHPKVIFDDSSENNSDFYSYSNIFNHSSLIITDFSSVAFDFAYLKKPIIYFHFDDEYHFNLNESYFDYESMGFGEIVKNHSQLVSLLLRYVESNCEMKEVYKKRVDNFFEFKDKNNCKRVYDFIFDD